MTLACIKLTYKITSTGVFWEAIVSYESEEQVEVNRLKGCHNGEHAGHMQTFERTAGKK